MIRNVRTAHTSGSTQNVYQFNLVFLLSPLTLLPLNFVDSHFLAQPLQIN